MNNDKRIIKELEKFAKLLRKKILAMALTAGSSSSHFGGALSIVEIISVLFHYKMNLKRKNEDQWHLRDRFILSKGHACLAYYAALNLKGFITDQQLKSFENVLFLGTGGSSLGGKTLVSIKENFFFKKLKNGQNKKVGSRF